MKALFLSSVWRSGWAFANPHLVNVGMTESQDRKARQVRAGGAGTQRARPG
jgi:hypothetical protein